MPYKQIWIVKESEIKLYYLQLNYLNYLKKVEMLCLLFTFMSLMPEYVLQWDMLAKPFLVDKSVYKIMV